MKLYSCLIPWLMAVISTSALAELNVTASEAGVFVRPGAVKEEGVIVIPSMVEQIVPETKVVAKLGTKFGIRYSLSGKKETNNQVTLLYLTPGIIDANGERHDKYVEVKDLSATSGSHTIAFQITEANELVPGIWQMMVFEKDRLLIKETFEVILKGTEVLSDFKQADQ